VYVTQPQAKLLTESRMSGGIFWIVAKLMSDGWYQKLIGRFLKVFTIVDLGMSYYHY